MSTSALTNQSRIKASIKQGGKESVKSGSNKLTHYFRTSCRAIDIRYIRNTILVICFIYLKMLICQNLYPALTHT